MALKPKTLGRRMTQSIEHTLDVIKSAGTHHRSFHVGGDFDPENDPNHELRELFNEFDSDQKGYLLSSDISSLLKNCQLDKRLVLGDDTINLLAGLLSTTMDRRNQGRIIIEDFIYCIKMFQDYTTNPSGTSTTDLSAISTDSLTSSILRRTKSFGEFQVKELQPLEEVVGIESPKAAATTANIGEVIIGGGPTGSVRASQSQPRKTSMARTATISLGRRKQSDEFNLEPFQLPSIKADLKGSPIHQEEKEKDPSISISIEEGRVLDVDPEKTNSSLKMVSPPLKKEDKEGGLFKPGFRQTIRRRSRMAKHMLTALSPLDYDDWEDEREGDFEKKMRWIEKIKWRINRYWDFEGEKAIAYIVIYGSNMVMYAVFFYRYYIKDYTSLLPAVPFAKGFTGMLYINTFLIFITMCRNLLSWLRGCCTSSIASPINKHVVIHRILGYLMVFAATGHALTHMFGTVPDLISVQSEDILNAKLMPRVPFTYVPTYAEVVFCTVPGVTGVVMLLTLYIMLATAIQRTRDKNFELFWYTHHLFIFFAALNYVHGSSHWLAYMEMPYWISLPVGVYILERLIRIYKSSKHITVLQLKHLQPDVTMIEMTKPHGCNPRAGNYVFICIPVLSRFQWHPFTLSSSPEEPILRVHIKDNGDWTHKLHGLAIWSTKSGEAGFNDNPNNILPEIQIDGPFGAPAEHIYDYQHVVLVAAGIGVTPFASTLRDIQLRIKHRKGGMNRLCSVDFYWVNRTQNPAQWFVDLLKELRSDPIAKECCHVYMYLTTNYSKNDIRSLLLWHGLRLSEEILGRSLLTQLDEQTYWGRPDWTTIIADTDRKCAQENKDMAVFYCGPKGLSKQLYLICRKTNAATGRTIRYLKENF